MARVEIPADSAFGLANLPCRSNGGSGAAMTWVSSYRM